MEVVIFGCDDWAAWGEGEKERTAPSESCLKMATEKENGRDKDCADGNTLLKGSVVSLIIVF